MVTRNRLNGKFIRELQHWSPEHFDEAYLKKAGDRPPRYVVYFPEHPRANKLTGLILRQIVAYEYYHGVEVKPPMLVHHINGIATDDSKENLLLTTRSEHLKEHARMKGQLVKRVCQHCGKVFEINLFRLREGSTRGTYCSYACYHAHPQSEETRKRHSEALKKARQEGRHPGRRGWSSTTPFPDS